MDKALLTTKDASSLIGCSQSTLRNYEAVGLLVPAVKVGNRRYYSRSLILFLTVVVVVLMIQSRGTFYQALRL